MSTCINCGAPDRFVASLPEEVILIMDDGTEVPLSETVQSVAICEVCGEPNPTEEQETLAAKALGGAQKGLSTHGWKKKIKKWMRKPLRKPFPDITLPKIPVGGMGGSGGGGYSGDPQAYPYIAVVGGAPCGPLHTPFSMLRNSHPERAIRVHVEIYAEHTNNPPEKKHYDVPAQSTVSMGCAVPGPTLQRFEFRPTRYEWLT